MSSCSRKVVAALDQRAVELPVERGAGVKRPTAAMLPRAGHCGKARDRVHLRAAVARAREAETDAEEAALGPPVEPGELDDRRFGRTAKCQSATSAVGVR